VSPKKRLSDLDIEAMVKKQQPRQKALNTFFDENVDVNEEDDKNKNTIVDSNVSASSNKNTSINNDKDESIDVHGNVNTSENVLRNAFKQPLDTATLKTDFKKRKKKKPKFEDIHTRRTVWLRKDLIELVEKEAEVRNISIAKIVNDAIELRFRLMANDLLPDEEES
jgi:hypothetical protein